MSIFVYVCMLTISFKRQESWSNAVLSESLAETSLSATDMCATLTRQQTDVHIASGGDDLHTRNACLLSPAGNH